MVEELLKVFDTIDLLHMRSIVDWLSKRMTFVRSSLIFLVACVCLKSFAMPGSKSFYFLPYPTLHFLAQLKVRIVVFTFRVRHVGFVSSFLELVKLRVDSGKRLLDLFLEFLAKFPNALGVT